jgi:predicted MPP superfamily phosphohydrolase
VFGLILTLLVTLMQCYVFWRASSILSLRRLVSARLLMEGGIALWALFLLCRYSSPELAGNLAIFAELWNMTWMGTLFLLSVPLLGVDIGTGFGFAFKHHVAQLRGIALIAGALHSVLAIVQGHRAPIVQRYDVYVPELPQSVDGTVIVALSDLHLGTVLGQEWIANCVERVQAERPDVVVLLGDIFEGHGTMSTGLIAPLRRLSAPLGVWGVMGNHESHSLDGSIIELLDHAGVNILRNTWTELRPGLVLAGVDDLGGYADEVEPVRSALDHRPAGSTVLLSHSPLATELAASKGVDLMLSGHTHGGQIWPFDYLVMLRFPLLAGQYDAEGMTVIVSRGTGTWGPRMRLWHPGEILRITLHSQSDIRTLNQSGTNSK